MLRIRLMQTLSQTNVQGSMSNDKRAGVTVSLGSCFRAVNQTLRCTAMRCRHWHVIDGFKPALLRSDSPGYWATINKQGDSVVRERKGRCVQRLAGCVCVERRQNPHSAPSCCRLFE